MGQVIRAKRKALGYSQEDLAELVDRTPSHIGQIERGDSLPSVDTLIKLVEILSIDGRQIFSNGNESGEIEDIVFMLGRLDSNIQAFIFDIIRMAYKKQMKRR